MLYGMGRLFLLCGLFLLRQQAAPAPADLDRVAIGAFAPDFELPSAAGKTLRLSSLRGKSVVLVFYRGYW